MNKTITVQEVVKDIFDSYNIVEQIKPIAISLVQKSQGEITEVPTSYYKCCVVLPWDGLQGEISTDTNRMKIRFKMNELLSKFLFNLVGRNIILRGVWAEVDVNVETLCYVFKINLDGYIPDIKTNGYGYVKEM